MATCTGKYFFSKTEYNIECHPEKLLVVLTFGEYTLLVQQRFIDIIQYDSIVVFCAEITSFLIPRSALL